MPESLFQIEERTKEITLDGGATLTLRSRAVTVRFPFLAGGLIWNRPISVTLRMADGQERNLPVHDATRIAQIQLLGVGVVGALLIGMVLGRRRR
jgi:hypothetical protein